MRIIGNDIKRFWSKTIKVGSCIEWTAYLDKDGRGKFMTGPRGQQRTHVATRWIYERVHGPIARGSLVLHECDNPKCVSLQHLSVGTQALNMEQMVRRGRVGKRASISIDQALSIKLSLAHGMSIANVARRLGVPYIIVWNIERGNSWRHVE